MKDESSKSSLGGASALAAMAGINLGGGGGIDVAGLFETLIGDYQFNKDLIKKYDLNEKLSENSIKPNLVFPNIGSSLRDFIKKYQSTEKETLDLEEQTFETFKKLKDILSTTKDKESGNLILSATFEDRFMAKELVNIYLKEMSNYIKKLDFKEINDQMNYYESELAATNSIDLRSNLNELISSLIKKKVLSQAGDFYMVKQMIRAQVPYIKDKVKPKRALIIIVAFITSIILGIFLVFFREFLKGEKEPEKIKREDSPLSF
jgi:capsular polysaccharide biosynthesis protein